MFILHDDGNAINIEHLSHIFFSRISSRSLPLLYLFLVQRVLRHKFIEIVTDLRPKQDR